jgi:hypothetical protein
MAEVMAYYYKTTYINTGKAQLCKRNVSRQRFLGIIAQYKHDWGGIKTFIEVPESCVRNIFGNDTIDCMSVYDELTWPEGV